MAKVAIASPEALMVLRPVMATQLILAMSKCAPDTEGTALVHCPTAAQLHLVACVALFPPSYSSIEGGGGDLNGDDGQKGPCIPAEDLAIRSSVAVPRGMA